MGGIVYFNVYGVVVWFLEFIFKVIVVGNEYRKVIGIDVYWFVVIWCFKGFVELFGIGCFLFGGVNFRGV